MVQAYLGRPNYTNAMNTGLQNRLGYDKLQDSKEQRMSDNALAMFLSGTRSGGASGGGGNERLAPFSPEERAGYRANRMAEDAGELALLEKEMNIENAMNQDARAQEKLDAEIALKTEKQAADIKSKQAETERLGKNAEVTRTKNLADTLGKMAASATQETLPDLYDWFAESGGVDRSAYPSEEEIADWTPVEAKKRISQIVEGSTYRKNTADIQAGLNKAEALRVKEAKADAKAATKAKSDAHKEVISLEKAIQKTLTTGGMDDLVMAQMAKSNPVMAKALMNKDQSEYVGIMRERQRQLIEEFGIEAKRQLTKSDARAFLEAAGGDPVKARKLATAEGFKM